MIEFKELDFVVSHQIPMAENPELLAWSGTNSGPVVAWNEETPVNRWNDILFLLERLNSKKKLVPEIPSDRIKVMGLSHEICGELGFGWNRRLDFMRPADDGVVSEYRCRERNMVIEIQLKYQEEKAQNISNEAASNRRVINLLDEMRSMLESQKEL